MTPRHASTTLPLIVLLGLTAGSAGAQPQQFGGPALPRDDFNRLAMLADVPLFWVEDKNDNKLLEPAELELTLLGQGHARWVRGGAFTPGFIKVYKDLVELRRREAVRLELGGGRPTLVASDFSGLPPAHKKMLRALLLAAEVIEDLHLRQTGAFRLKGKLRRIDPASRYLFWRNHGPWCVSPEASKDPFCHGLPTFDARVSEAYPADRPQDDALCKALGEHPDAKQLLDPFSVVRKDRAGKLTAAPITEAFRAPMRKVARHLRAAARAVAADPSEKALHAYLLAAARAFENNDWQTADEAWAAMNAQNSKWYLRVAPDEVYFDPCQQKAGFHVSLARIDQGSLSWQQKLTPLRETMERELARHIGAPYKAREVRFHMPDFIQVVLNAGDARHPLGATIGQSLPNWGRVAGRGRTVVMTNLYTDPDSMRIARDKAAALLSDASMAHFTGETTPFLVNIILHEATHNFGPHSDYRVGGKTPKEIFGGKLASTMEELKAQTGGLWYLQLLRRKGHITEVQLKQAYTQAITWAFGHISRGMFTPSGNVRPYSQLAAVQVGTFMKDGALTFKNGKFTIHFDKLAQSIDRLTREVGQLKARGDRDGAQALIDRYVKGKGHKLVHEKHIAERLLGFPKATFRYGVKL